MPVLQGLNPEVDASMGGSTLLPPGKYVFTIVASADEATMDGTGRNLVVDFEGPEGAKVKHWFTYSGGREAWMAPRGQQQLRLCAECAGVKWGQFMQNGSDVMHGRQVGIVVKHKESNKLKDDGTPFVNMAIANFIKPAECAAPQAQATPPQGAAQPKAPW